MKGYLEFINEGISVDGVEIPTPEKTYTKKEVELKCRLAFANGMEAMSRDHPGIGKYVVDDWIKENL